MGIFSRFENKAENVIEGSGGRGRGGIEPVKLAKRACKEMEREKMVGVGHEYAPTLYNILVSPEDDAAMNGYYPSLAGEIETYLTGQGAQNGLVFDCPPLVRFIVDDGLKRGRFDIIAESVSPAIIAELRHEEMVRYGLERDHAPVQSCEVIDKYEPVDDFAPSDDFAPTGEPLPVDDYTPDGEPLPVDDYAPTGESLPTEDYANPEMDPEPQVPAQRNYPPTDLPPETPIDMQEGFDDGFAFEEIENLAAEPMPGAAQTVMLTDPAPEPIFAYLVDYKRQKRYRLRDDRTIIGRETACDVIIPDPSVSRRHAEILHNDRGWIIRDTGSTNGLIVNGVITTQARIYDGDIIDLGTTQLEFQEG